MRALVLPVIATLTLVILGCSGSESTDEPPIRSAGGTSAAKDAPDADSFQVKFETSAGDFVVEFNPSWAPIGVARVKELVEAGFYDKCRFFRVISGFMAQFGINGNPEVHAKWDGRTIDDDPVLKSNTRGFVTFAKTGAPNSRSTQLFINYSDNSNLDSTGFAPVGKVIEGMEVVDKLYNKYGEGAPRGSGPSQGRIQREGTMYLREEYPLLDFIKKARIVDGEDAEPKESKDEAGKEKAAETKDKDGNEEDAEPKESKDEAGKEEDTDSKDDEKKESDK